MWSQFQGNSSGEATVLPDAAIRENEATTTKASSASDLRTIIKSILRVYFVGTRRTRRGNECPDTVVSQRRSRMQKFVLGALLIAVSTIQMASAAEYHARKARRHWDFRSSYNQLNEPHRNIESFGLGTTGGGASFLHPSDITPSGS